MHHYTVLVKVCSQPLRSHPCLQSLLQRMTMCQNGVTSVSRSHAPSLAGMSFLPFLPPSVRVLQTSQLLQNQFQKSDSQKKRQQCISVDTLPSCLLCFTLLWRKIENQSHQLSLSAGQLFVSRRKTGGRHMQTEAMPGSWEEERCPPPLRSRL